MLSRPVKSCKPSKLPVYTESLNDAHNSEGDPSTTNEIRVRKLSRSQPTLNKINHTDVRASVFNSDYPQGSTEVTYPRSLMKHSYEDLLNEHCGPIPVQIPVVPSTQHFNSCGEKSESRTCALVAKAPESYERRLSSDYYDPKCYDSGTNHLTTSYPSLQRHQPQVKFNPPGSPTREALLGTPQTTANSSPSNYYTTTLSLFQQHSSLSKFRHSVSVPIPTETPKVPSPKCVSIQNTHLYSDSVPPSDSRMTNDAENGNTSLHSNVNNHTKSLASSQTAVSDAYRSRSYSYSEAQPFPLPFRPRSMSESNQSVFPRLAIAARLSSQAKLCEQSSSSEDEMEEDSPFIVPLRKSQVPSQIATSTDTSADSRTKPKKIVVNVGEPKLRPTDFSTHLSTASLPSKVRIIKGTLHPAGGVAITRGHDLILHFIKHTSTFLVRSPEGAKYMIPFNSAIKLAVLYNPSNPGKPMPKGFKFRSAGDIMKLKSVPLVVAATKSYEGGSSKSTVREGQILLIRGIKTDSANGYRLMAKTITGHKKLLPPNCVAHFSTSPSLTSLTLQEFIQCKIKLPQYVALQYPTSIHRSKGLPGVVFLLEPTKQTSIIATCPTLNDTPNAKLLEIPLLSSVIIQDLEENDSQSKMLTEKLYSGFDACTTSYCSDMMRTTSQDVQSIFLKCLSSSERSFGWELVRLENSAEKEIPNPLLTTPLHSETCTHNYRFSQCENADGISTVPTEPLTALAPQSFDDSTTNCSQNELQTTQPVIIDTNPLTHSSVLSKNVVAINARSKQPDFTTKVTPPSNSIAQGAQYNVSPNSLGDWESSSIEIGSTSGSGSPSNELVKQIQSLEAKYANTDKQLLEFSRQFSEVKNTLTSIQRSMTSEANSSLNVVKNEQLQHALDICDVAVSPVKEMNSGAELVVGDSSIRTKSQSSNILPSQKPVHSSKEFDALRRKGNLGKKLNQAKARFEKLINRKQVPLNSSPAMIASATTIHSLKSIPETGLSNDTIDSSYSIPHNQTQLADRINSNEHSNADFDMNKPPIQPKPPSLRKQSNRNVLKKPHTMGISTHTVSADPGDNCSTISQQSSLEPDCCHSIQDNNTSKVQVNKNQLPEPPTEKLVAHQSAEQLSQDIKSTDSYSPHQKPPLAPKPKVTLKNDLKLISTGKLMTAEKPTQKDSSKLEQLSLDSNTEDLTLSNTRETTLHDEEDQIVALVDDLTVWCSQIEAEVNQLTSMQAEC